MKILFLRKEERKVRIAEEALKVIKRIRMVILLIHYVFLNILLVSKMNQIEQRQNIGIMMMNQNFIFIQELIILLQLLCIIIL